MLYVSFFLTSPLSKNLHSLKNLGGLNLSCAALTTFFLFTVLVKPLMTRREKKDSRKAFLFSCFFSKEIEEERGQDFHLSITSKMLLLE